MAKSASDYFIAGRSISIWVFVLAATATSFSGWTFMGHPALVWRDGIPYGYASFYAITIPFTGVIFLKRQWLLGKRYGFVTPGEMFSSYYGTDAMRYLTVLVAMVFSVPYLGLQLRASGFLFNVLTDGMMSLNTGMWLLAIIVVLYVGLGGLRSVAYVDTVQCILLAAGISLIGIIALNAVGGWSKLQEGIVDLSQNKLAHVVTVKGDKLKLYDSGGARINSPEYITAMKGFLDEKGKNLVRTKDSGGNYVEFWNKVKNTGTGIEVGADGSLASPMKVAWQSKIKVTPDGYAHFIAIPGVIQFVVPGTKAKGGVWTGIMILTYMFALMGIQSAPAFSMWAFANKNPAPFAPQQVWASSFGIGIIILTATWIQGFAGHILISQDVISPIPGGKQAMLVPDLINLMADTAPFLVGLLAVCALAAMQSTGAAYMSTASGMITRDIYKHLFAKDLGHTAQKMVGRVSVLIVVGLALVIATFATDALVMLGGLAVSYGFQMWPALIGICYVPWLTRQGIVVGLIAGLIAVTVTYIGDFGVKYALTIHSAGWGIIFNLGLAIAISAVTQPDKSEADRRLEFHTFLNTHAGVPAEKKGLIPFAWALVIGWFLLAIGPLTPVIGNSIFGSPLDASTWTFGMPSIWAWALLMWAIGVFMMWFLAYYMEFSTNIKGDFEGIDDYADAEGLQKAPVRMDLDSP
ncbi:MAG: sodium:solute symporter family protein [Nitrospinota bacterium]